MSNIHHFPTPRDRALPFRDQRRIDREAGAAINARSSLDRQVATLASAVKALDARFADESVPVDLDIATRLARAVVACHAAGVPVTAAEADEASRALVVALRALAAGEVRS